MVDADPDRWLTVPAEGSGDGWRDMRNFVERLEGPLRERLLDAIEG
jgi:hypothetical protein